MKIRIIKGYRDSILRRVVRKDEELTVTDARADALISKGVAVSVPDETDAKIAERDEKIKKLEAEIKKLKKAE